jgi:hypothetical protein
VQFVIRNSEPADLVRECLAGKGGALRPRVQLGIPNQSLVAKLYT